MVDSDAAVDLISDSRRRWALLVIAAFAMLVPLLAIAVASVRGPSYLETNIDPEYDYLLNALLIGEGRAPQLVEHPGTPVQCIGAVALRTLNAIAPQGPFRDDVLLHPERYIEAFQVAITGMTTVLSFVGGLLAFRATGRIVAAAAVQSAPLALLVLSRLMDRPIPEPLMMGLAMVLCGCLLLSIHGKGSGRRLAIVMGLIVGFAIATKMLFVLMAAVPLAALRSWRHRLVYCVATVGFFVVGILPMGSGLARTWKWVMALATHTGKHGAGSSGVVDLKAYPKQLQMLIDQEKYYFVIAAASLVVAVVVGLVLRRRLSVVHRRMCRTLLALSLSQILLLLLVAKHPAEHYLTAGASMCGLSLCLIAGLTEGWKLARLRFVGIGMIVAVIGWLGVSRYLAMRVYQESCTQMATEEIPNAAFIRSPENAGVLFGARVSCVESALQHGNYFAGNSYSGDLERLYPGVLIWDWLGITAFGRPATEQELARVWKTGSFRAIVSRWLNERQTQPPGLEVTTLRLLGPLGQERLVEVRKAGAPKPAP